MTGPQPHERFEELAAGHALAALEPAEAEAFLAHVGACAACERAVAQHAETLAHLAYAADPVDLPASLLEGIREGVRVSGREMGLAGVDAAVEVPVDLAAERERRRFKPQRFIGVAAAAALVLSLGIWNADLRREQSVSDQKATTLTAAVKLLETKSSRRVELTDETGQAVAFAVLHDARKVSLVVSGLPRNDTSTSTYVLWQTGDAGTRAVGTFDVRGDGVDVVQGMTLAGDLPAFSAFAVTHEPGRRAPRAPGALPVANGPVTA